MTSSQRPPFDSIYRHGYVRMAVCVPEVALADPRINGERTQVLASQAAEAGAAVAVFPELGLTGYSCQDLFHQQAILESTEEALAGIVEASGSLATLLLVGAPLRIEGKLFNCAVAIYRGAILGVVPKTYLPNYREFYEKRHFSAAHEALAEEAQVLGQSVPFGNNLIFAAEGIPGFALHAEICEDLWVPLPPSTLAALAGATLLCNLSASNVTLGKADYRRMLCASQSARCAAAYAYSAAGTGESTTDLAWDGHAMIWEHGRLIAESERFARVEQVILADVDLDRIRQERLRTTLFSDGALEQGRHLEEMRQILFKAQMPEVSPQHRDLLRPISRFPYVPESAEKRDERCREAYEIQVHGLAQRLEATGIQRLVLGVSGGLDSTQALLVAVKTFDLLGYPRSNILAYTMPGFATSSRTLKNAWGLMNSLGVQGEEIDIRPSCRQMLEDLGHPAAKGEPVHDVTFENVQAGERTSHLFRLANHRGGLVLGTGDLSELALGWTTYGVGDQMSHYNVNGSVPKTLIQHLVRWSADNGELGEEASEVLRSILGTEISPELVPAAEGAADSGSADSGPAQSTEAQIGPYELQDFHLYYVTRYGFRPSKVAFLAWRAWADAEQGTWPEGMPESERNEYDLATIKRWLRVFVHRFFELSQFKRSAMPDGPKVGSGGSLSPRGDWRAPSDASASAWLAELDANVPD